MMTPMRFPKRRGSGFMLPELLICVAMLAIAIAALMGAFLGQIMLNEHARNLTWAIHDANRVMERLRQANTGAACTAPSAVAPVGFANWDAWLAADGAGKSIQPLPNTNELIVVTCQDQDGGALAGDYCGTAGTPQVSANEWKSQGATTTFDPIRVTVTVCWRHRTRVIGECAWNGAVLSADDSVAVPGELTNLNGVIESPATLVTLMTCRR